jgi:hypothetical protein
VALLGLLLLLAGRASAAPGAFTSRASFDAAVPGGTVSVDFESLAPGTDVGGSTRTAPGAAAGVVLPPDLLDVLHPAGPPLALHVVAGPDNPAASGSNSLGTYDPGNFDAFVAGTDLDLVFTSPLEAFGLVVVTPEEPGLALFDGDLQLLVPGEATASLTLADGQSLGSFGGREYRAYFLGVVGAAPFQQASLVAGIAAPTSGFFFNVDDLAIPVPEPGRAISLAVGAALLAALARLRKREVRSCDGLS